MPTRGDEKKGAKGNQKNLAPKSGGGETVPSGRSLQGGLRAKNRGKKGGGLVSSKPLSDVVLVERQMTITTSGGEARN